MRKDLTLRSTFRKDVHLMFSAPRMHSEDDDQKPLDNEEQVDAEDGGRGDLSSSEEDSGMNDADEETANQDERSAKSPFVFDRNRNPNPDIPVGTVTVLEDPLASLDDEIESNGGGKLYLVGTAHFSRESQADVIKTITETEPDIVMVELCPSRVNILSLDEDTLLIEAQSLTTQKILSTVRQTGLVQGIMHVLLLSMSAHITKQLGMAPGGEFRAAFKAVHDVPGCRLCLGDRPIQVTLQRALGALTWWQKLRLFWYIVVSHNTSITKEEVERCKQSDLLEELLREMAGEFPELSRIFVEERDQYMAHGLLKLLRSVTQEKRRRLPENSPWEPVNIVGVVGIGHAPGIVANWNKECDMASLMSVPEPSRASLYTKYALRGGFAGVTCYGVYRLVYWGIGAFLHR